MSKVQILTFCFTFIIQLFEYEAFPTYSSLADELGKESNSCNCGISKFGAMSCGSREGRIIGGRVVKENEIPWQVNIEMCFFDICERLCGGSVIGRKYILTAAHCILHNTHHLQVSLGLLNDSNPISDERVYSIESTKLHNDWNAVGAQNDIALLKLDRDIEFDTAVRPICLPSNPDNLFAKKPAVVSGWGTTSEENYESSPVMKRTILRVLENGDDKCRNNDPYRRPLSNKYICAFGTDTDACHIDSGGPLTLVENNTCSLAGIVSFGNGCAKKDFAGVYTRVSAHLDWIRENTLDDECLNRRHT